MLIDQWGGTIDLPAILSSFNTIFYWNCVYFVRLNPGYWLLAQVGDNSSLTIPRMGDVVSFDLSDGVFTGARASHITPIQWAFILSSNTRNNWLNYGEKWCSMKEHETCTAEIHRKVIRMVTPMSELEAKLMLRQMGERVWPNNLISSCREAWFP